MQTFDAIVVGAGPAGSTIARALSADGWKVLLAEEHHKIGHPVQCAGLVSSRVLKMAGSDQMVLHPLGGASIWSPSLQRVRFGTESSRAFVISREGLDFHLAERAAHAGTLVETGWRFDRARRTHTLPGWGWEADFTTVSGKETVAGRILVGADGVASTVARSLRLRRPIELLPAYETEIPFPDSDPKEVEIYLGSALAPGFFGWSIPDGHGNVRVGVAMKARTDMTARDGYRALVKTMERRYGKSLPQPIDMMVSGIPVGMLPATATEGGLLVGDAAAQVKPLSGGGIFTGMRCAQIAGEVVSAALRDKDVSSVRLKEYERRWTAELGTEFERALYFRRLFVRLTDAELERLVEVLQDSRLTSAIVAFGDIDFPTVTARELLRLSPSLVRLFPKALSAYFRKTDGLAPELDLGPRLDRTHK